MHAARTSLPPPPPRLSGAPARWLPRCRALHDPYVGQPSPLSGFFSEQRVSHCRRWRVPSLVRRLWCCCLLPLSRWFILNKLLLQKSCNCNRRSAFRAPHARGHAGPLPDHGGLPAARAAAPARRRAAWTTCPALLTCTVLTWMGGGRGGRAHDKAHVPACHVAIRIRGMRERLLGEKESKAESFVRRRRAVHGAACLYLSHQHTSTLFGLTFPSKP